MMRVFAFRGELRHRPRPRRRTRRSSPCTRSHAAPLPDRRNNARLRREAGGSGEPLLGRAHRPDRLPDRRLRAGASRRTSRTSRAVRGSSRTGLPFRGTVDPGSRDQHVVFIGQARAAQRACRPAARVARGRTPNGRPAAPDRCRPALGTLPASTDGHRRVLDRYPRHRPDRHARGGGRHGEGARCAVDRRRELRHGV